MNARAWIVAAAMGVVGLACGWWLGVRHEAAPAVAGSIVVTAGPQDSPVTVSPAAAGSHVSLDDVRRVVREELAGLAGSGRSPGLVSSAAAEPEPPSPEQTATRLRAGSVIDAAITRRQWTDADVYALSAEFHQLTADQQADVMRDYAVAVNQGRIVPQTDRLPF